ncbi:lipopolysaccharide biosynthesis protein [Albibacterium indicum]|uniref:lipopolysaccharide biosynthesis protein n=1 Tax=Albibacterium indicum TaxID=2292082 RepID=UPI000E523CB8|nr:oligosaccharide flippase family protein [Pedobacter indicus]
MIDIVVLFKKIFSPSKNSFFNNVLILLGGSALGQVINLLMSPVITRIFPPEAFGVFGVFTSVINILTNSSSLKLEMALPLQKETDEFIELLWICLFANLGYALLIAAVLIFIPISVYETFNVSELVDFLWLIPLTLLITGCTRILTSAVVRFKAYKAISYSFINQILVKNVVQIILGLFSASGLSLIFGTFFNQGTGMTNLIRVLKKRKVLTWTPLSKLIIFSHVKEHRDYIFYGTPSGLINALGLYLPVPLVMYYFGPKEAGGLAFCITLISLPMRVVGKSVSQAFIGECAEMIREKKPGLSKLYKNLILRLSLLILVPFIIATFWGQPIFKLFFGQEWSQSGYFIQILALPFCLQFISSPLSQILNLLTLQKVQLIWDIIRVILTIGTLCLPPILGYAIDPTILIYSVGSSISYVLLILICLKYVTLKEKNIIR